MSSVTTINSPDVTQGAEGSSPFNADATDDKPVRKAARKSARRARRSDAPDVTEQPAAEQPSGRKVTRKKVKRGGRKVQRKSTAQATAMFVAAAPAESVDKTLQLIQRLPEIMQHFRAIEKLMTGI